MSFIGNSFNVGYAHPLYGRDWFVSSVAVIRSFIGNSFNVGYTHPLYGLVCVDRSSTAWKGAWRREELGGGDRSSAAWIGDRRWLRREEARSLRSELGGMDRISQRGKELGGGDRSSAVWIGDQRWSRREEVRSLRSEFGGVDRSSAGWIRDRGWSRHEEIGLKNIALINFLGNLGKNMKNMLLCSSENNEKKKKRKNFNYSF
ncbi:hypothetical protein SO802_015566 [Lithocarpus litseifolius]|uniref:Uncharacterized protein n=1 Tax=Lithocarpus litseifolius TaxID=425828 RepID=A0AAW2CU16_9ROSI